MNGEQEKREKKIEKEIPTSYHQGMAPEHEK